MNENYENTDNFQPYLNCCIFTFASIYSWQTRNWRRKSTCR
uniref:Uncharacterized protein n=1 Tax=Meloidogyne enterolobii TaxID=390850 RepID=A0A6V7VWF2_MELEN|nr:unnamed protein product [Meloidogyne enterolobii]